ncbi:MAG: RIP metalloprotease [Anaerolineales bacterium]
MSESLTLLIAFGAILGGVVIVHELGHFAAARAGGVRINELGIGLPPRLALLGSLWGAEISLNWIPLGGFVRPAGEFDASVPDGLAASPPLTRIGVLSAGSLANLLLSVSLMTAAFMVGWPDQVEVNSVEAGSPAAAAGLLPADRILYANGEPVREAGELRGLLEASAGAPVVLEIKRGLQIVETTIWPRTDLPEGHGPAGFTSSGVLLRYGPVSALGRATMKIADLFTATVQVAAGTLIPGESDPGVRLAGPLGLKQASDQAVRNASDWEEPFPVLYLAAWLSLAVAMTNLLPLPALDGGRILLVLIEVIRSRRMKPKVEKWVHALGMVGLLVLMLALTARDVMHPLF